MGSSVFGDTHIRHIQCNAAGGGNGGEDLPREKQPIEYTVECTVLIAVSSPIPSRATNCGAFLFRPRRAWFPSSLLSVIVHICQSIPLPHTLNHWSKTTIGDGEHQHQNNKS